LSKLSIAISVVGRQCVAAGVAAEAGGEVELAGGELADRLEVEAMGAEQGERV
jgi:hypothetical protein